MYLTKVITSKFGVLQRQKIHQSINKHLCSHYSTKTLSTIQPYATHRKNKKNDEYHFSTSTTGTTSTPSISMSTIEPSLHTILKTTQATKRWLSSYSSFAEPEPTLFAKFSIPTTDTSISSTTGISDDGQLRADIRVMGSILGKVIQEHEGVDILEKVEQMRSLAKAFRSSSNGKEDEEEEVDGIVQPSKLDDIAQFAQQLSSSELYKVARAFTHFLAIANAAESHHRSRRLKQSIAENDPINSCGALYPKKDSCGGTIPDLLIAGHSPETIFEALTTQTTELVLTAHPTEVNRRTILEKNRRIQMILTKADEYRAMNNTNSYDWSQLDEALYREISAIWLSDGVSRTKPTPVQEAEKGTLVIETVLWETLPQFLRKLDATCYEFLNQHLPLSSAPIKFASWMGGDRDGNPNVYPHTTRQVVLSNRKKAAMLFIKDLQQLESELSIITCSNELKSKLGTEKKIREPYRAHIRLMIQKLQKTHAWAEQELQYVIHEQEKISGGVYSKSTLASMHHHVEVITEDEVYLSKDEFLNDLMIIHRSLVETGNPVAADGHLTDVVRKVSSFGLTLIPLDVRQESTRHEEAIDAITRFLGLGSYTQWDEDTKISWLTSQISSKRPLIRSGVWYEYPEKFTSTVVDTLEIFRMIADQHEDSLGAYVISQATTPSDVLAVLLLQLDAGVKKPLRIAPLFETLDDLKGAAKTMKTLFSLPVYMGIINGKQEVMIGYSDSAKDAGRLAASWSQYETQEELATIARENNVQMTFFHGKGGTVGRGGNPQTFLAVLAHAPKTINGYFRVTEQGEMINQNLGYSDRAERTMDIYTAAVLAEKLTERVTPPSSWRDMMHTLSEISCDSYRKVVREDERFVPYFRAATPELELASLNIGSRPAKRNATGGVESLRAIPWNFAWTQTRLNLPTWLGVGDAIRSVLDSDKAQLLREMYRDWGSFRMIIDLVEMVLAKSEPEIAKHYDTVLVKDPKAMELGMEVRSNHIQTEQAILDLTQHKVLGGNNPLLLRMLQVRNPYVDCLNVLQAETLNRIRVSRVQDEDQPDDKILKDALMTTIKGVANGMGNTG
jgi:phosphoenolpyruvate carboxylase